MVNILLQRLWQTTYTKYIPQPLVFVNGISILGFW